MQRLIQAHTVSEFLALVRAGSKYSASAVSSVSFASLGRESASRLLAQQHFAVCALEYARPERAPQAQSALNAEASAAQGRF